MQKTFMMTAKEAALGAREENATEDYLAAYDAMMARRSPEQAAREARINAEAHCNQAVKAYQAEAAGLPVSGMEARA